ncbi:MULTISPECIES: hypothetical protein [Microbispora]|jgi:hypothetical protein|uniref:Uncharacterized protein n=4 Tax=Microbispora TaxID=2005 RepID=A0A1N7GEB3_9ACTN|nr:MULTISPECIES: hypothetical protein [Microbispora]KAB8185316.1 hypothetical protein FH610_010970 [Microbispora catharanthi]MBE3014835.1 hypothetical protein [Microbispora sitophila]OPG05036.1 hypothetical protein B1L11_36280 [Microbispora sp. GKU 823]TQS23003.1 hypothetical protein FLX08_06620 [Microbispora hainanensis]TQS31211.1 hypothetical protein FLW16_02795 [Microbispora sp. KK1-11]
MLAIAAAVVFGIAFLLDLLNASIGIGLTALLALGLCLLSLHQAGVGTAGVNSWRGGWRGGRVRR